MKKSMMALTASMLILSISAFEIFSIQNNIDVTKDSLRLSEPQLFMFPTSINLKYATMGFNNFISDIMWMDVVQYVGMHYQTDRDFKFLYVLLYSIDNIDPRFTNAISYGAFFLESLANQFDNAQKLLLVGMKNNSDAWEYPFEIGFLYYAYKKDYSNAYKYFKIAVEKPGIPPQFRTFLPYVIEKGQTPEAALAVWEYMCSRKSGSIAEGVCEANIKRLYNKIAADKLNSALKTYKLRYGSYPTTLAGLLSSKIIKNIPALSEGEYYVYEPKTGKINIMHITGKNTGNKM